MDSLHEDIGDFIGTRQRVAYREIVDDPEFKQLRLDIINLQD